MARTITQLPTDGAGKKLDAFSYTSPNGTDGTVYANPLVVIDSSGNEVATATSTPAGTERALVVRPASAVPITDNSGSITVDDGAASLTVDAPVATPVYVRLSDGSSAISALPVTDNAGSLTVDDGAGSLTVDSAQLPSALVSGRLSVDASGAPVPVTDNGGTLSVDDGAGSLTVDGSVAVSSVSGSVTTDPSDRAARDVGRVRLYDGTNSVGLYTQRTVQASTGVGVPVEQLVPIRPTYQAALPEVTLATTTGVKELVTLFKSATPDVDIHIVEILLTVRTATTAGGANVEAQFITAENVTPGGTSVTPQSLHTLSGTATPTVRSVVTGAPTTSGQIFIRRGLTQNALAYEVPVFKASTLQEAIRLATLTANGIRITANVASALTGAPIITGYVRWIEL